MQGNANMDQNPNQPTRNERRSLALAALIMSLVALLCAFIEYWRIFAIVVAGAALMVALFVISRVRRKGRSVNMSVASIIIALCAAFAAGYFLSQLVAGDTSAVPPELHDTASEPPNEETMERLRRNMDSTQ